MLPEEVERKQAIALQIEPQLRQMDESLGIALALVTNGGFRVERTENRDEIVVYTLLGLYVKILKTFRSIQIACESGLTQDATALTRVLFETVVALCFIAQRDSRLRARMYQARMYVKQRALFIGWRSRKGFQEKDTGDHLQQTEKVLSKIARGLTGLETWPEGHWYGVALPSKIAALKLLDDSGVGLETAMTEVIQALSEALKDHFSGRNIWEAANALGLMATYETFFRYATSFSHAEDWWEHIEVLEDGTVRLRLIPAVDDKTVRTMKTAMLFLFWAAEALNSVTDAKLDERLEAIQTMAIGSETEARS